MKMNWWSLWLGNGQMEDYRWEAETSGNKPVEGARPFTVRTYVLDIDSRRVCPRTYISGISDGMKTERTRDEHDVME